MKRTCQQNPQMPEHDHYREQGTVWCEGYGPELDTEKPKTEIECLKTIIEHRFNLGNRCICGIRQDYMEQSLAMLDSWPKEEKGKEWENKRDRLLECPRKVSTEQSAEKK